MRRYETVFIVNPDLSEEQQRPLFEKLNGLVTDAQGLMVKFDQWGHKKLAYEVKKHTRGYYVLLDFCGDGALVKDLERNLRLDDRILKYMTVAKEEVIDLDALKAEIEEAKEQEAARKKEAEAQPAAQAVSEGGQTGETDSGEPEGAEASEEPERAEANEEPETPAIETPAPDTTEETSTDEEQKNTTT